MATAFNCFPFCSYSLISLMVNFKLSFLASVISVGHTSFISPQVNVLTPVMKNLSGISV